MTSLASFSLYASLNAYNGCYSNYQCEVFHSFCYFFRASKLSNCSRWSYLMHVPCEPLLLLSLSLWDCQLPLLSLIKQPNCSLQVIFVVKSICSTLSCCFYRAWAIYFSQWSTLTRKGYLCHTGMDLVEARSQTVSRCKGEL